MKIHYFFPIFEEKAVLSDPVETAQKTKPNSLIKKNNKKIGQIMRDKEGKEFLEIDTKAITESMFHKQERLRYYSPKIPVTEKNPPILPGGKTHKIWG